MDLIANVMKEAGQEIETEPLILPEDEENLPWKTANRSPGALVNNLARGFCTGQQDSFF